MKKTKKVLCMLLFGAGLAYVLLMGLAFSYTLPNENIRANVENASKVITKEGKYPSDFIGGKENRLDNFTDSIILMVAYNADGGKKSPFELALANTYYQTNANPVKGLETMTTNGDVETNHSYTRYWFGTAGVVRVLMEFMGIRGVRKMLMAVVFALIITVVILLTKKAGWRYGALFAVSIFFAKPWLIGVSLQFAPVFIISLLGMIAVCLMEGRNKQEKTLPYLFIVMGVMTSFHDLLTCPLLSLALPLLVVLLFDVKQGEKKWLRRIIKFSVIWAISYAGMYIMKWGITSIVLNQNTFQIAIEQFLFRTDAAGDFSKIDTVVENFQQYFGGMGLAVLIMLTVVSIIRIVKNRGSLKTNSKKCLPFLVLLLYPVVWYLVLSNHSHIHVWMTYRLVMVSMLAYMFGLTSICDAKK